MNRMLGVHQVLSLTHLFQDSRMVLRCMSDLEGDPFGIDGSREQVEVMDHEILLVRILWIVAVTYI